ncbi:MAG: MBL fold metallo-hydrolase [Smithellaceae bacterium]|nr:MBL fold metallo-hydrolase [Smithellaceae bacterium]
MITRHTETKAHPFITVICDNYTTREDLEASWGFACLIAHGGKNILFDTGSDGVVLSHNMARLGIEPASIDLLMISHQHWDHVGGIYAILSARRDLRVFVPRSFSVHFQEDMKRYGARIIDVDGADEILPGLFTTGELDGPVKEQAALVQTEAGTVVITGCAHPGIVRIVETAKKILPKDDIALVMGGFHLLHNRDDEILNITERFKTLGVRYAAASHCSGERARKLFSRQYGDHFIALGAGSTIGPEHLK